jgi:hypothetical protein
VFNFTIEFGIGSRGDLWIGFARKLTFRLCGWIDGIGSVSEKEPGIDNLLPADRGMGPGIHEIFAESICFRFDYLVQVGRLFHLGLVDGDQVQIHVCNIQPVHSSSSSIGSIST